MATQTNGKTFSTLPLHWKEVYYTNCPLVSASNAGQELGWTREEYKKTGIKYGLLRSRRENNWYPLGRFLPAARGHPRDQAHGEEQGSSFWDVEL